jgi:hypothetical protein
MPSETLAVAVAVAVAVVAFIFSVAQWIESRRSDRIKLLLGEKETVAFEAIRITRRPNMFIAKDTLRALVLSTLFEGSDRARIQVYGALDKIRARHQQNIVALRTELGQAAQRYGSAVDIESYKKRLRQLDAALPWVVGGSG